MGILDFLTTLFQTPELSFAPEDKFGLITRIEALKGRGIGLEKITISPREGTGCLIWQSRMNSPDPATRFYIQYVAKFNDGREETVQEECGHIVKDEKGERFLVGCLYGPQLSPSPVKAGRLYLDKQMAEEAGWLEREGYPVEVVRV